MTPTTKSHFEGDFQKMGIPKKVNWHPSLEKNALKLCTITFDPQVITPIATRRCSSREILTEINLLDLYKRKRNGEIPEMEVLCETTKYMNSVFYLTGF